MLLSDNFYSGYNSDHSGEGGGFEVGLSNLGLSGLTRKDLTLAVLPLERSEVEKAQQGVFIEVEKAQRGARSVARTESRGLHGGLGRKECKDEDEIQSAWTSVVADDSDEGQDLQLQNAESPEIIIASSPATSV